MSENYDDSMQKFADDFVALDPHDLVLAGIYANKPGYHNKRDNLPSSDYSVREFSVDRLGPGDKASAIDMTSRSAQGGDYTVIKKYSNRLFKAGQNRDPRMDGWREFFGQTDDDGGVEGWDFSKKTTSTADKSHLWHIHMSEHRGFITSTVNKEAALSVLKGETLAEYQARGGKLVTDTITPPPSSGSKLTVNGHLDSATIKRWQQIMHTPQDGVISRPRSELVIAVQKHLNSALHVSLRVDGDGIVQNNRQYETVGMLQRYLGTKVDYRLSTPVSECIKALQARLNAGRF